MNRLPLDLIDRISCSNIRSLMSRVLRLLALALLSGSASVSTFADDDTADEMVRVFVYAQQAPTSQFYAQRSRQDSTPSRSAQRQHSESIRREQKQLRKSIAPFVVKEHASLRMALNGFRATVKKKNLQQLRNVPGVKDVRILSHFEIDNTYSVPWVEAPKVWENSGDGEGMTIAIIDSGIDYLHANFGGDGSADAFAANDPNTLEPGSFPNQKVIGGWDFAGPTYNSREDEDPQPDADPLDINGHGSHVAGTAAGLGVPNSLGSGVARGANLYALKVFSDEGGSTDLTVDAIERALDPNMDGSIDDRVDVINMSLGARFGLPTDPAAEASGNAVAAGIIVVASAGNNGDLPFVTGSPAVNPQVISVAATTPGDRRQIALAIDSDGGRDLYHALEGSQPVKITHTGFSAGLVIAVDSNDTASAYACVPLANEAAVSGKITLVERGDCSFIDKFLNVQEAGAAGMILVNSSANVEDLFIIGGILDDITIPGMMITRAAGDSLLLQLNNSHSLSAEFSISNTLPAPNTEADRVASFTSSGPGALNAGFKPDIAAPGRLIFSTAAGTGTQGRQLRGTSMAAPHVAGMAALIRQQRPNLPPAAIKAILQNTTQSAYIDTDSTPAALERQGAGVMHGGRAMLAQAYALPAGVAFAYSNTLGDQQLGTEITLHDLSGTQREFSVNHVPASTLGGVTVRCPDTVVVDAAGSATFSIMVDIENASVPADTSSILTLSSASGWCEFQDDLDTLRVAYTAQAEGAADITLATPAPDDSQLQLTNQSSAAGIASSFVLAASKTTRSDAAYAIRNVGWRKSSQFNFPLLEFGITVDRVWDHPSTLRWIMYVDTDFDGQSERVLFAIDSSYLRFDPGQIITGMDFVTDPDDLGSDRSILNWMVEDVDLHDRVITLPFFNTDNGGLALFKPGETAFNFRLMLIDRYGMTDEISGTVDLTQAAASEQQRLIIAPQDSATVSASTVPQLWLFPNNVSTSQSRVFIPPSDHRQQQKNVHERHRDQVKPRQ